jgi:rare lipoprotein A
VGFAALTLAACATGSRHLDVATQGAPTARYGGYKVGKPYEVKGVWYYPQEQPGYDEIGIASWYGEQFHNHYTADGEVFDMGLPSAAHKTLPLPSLVEVTNLANGRTLIVRVNDRGPFVDGRVIDMSKAAAEELGFVAAGVTRVRVRYVGQASAPPEPRQHQASNDAPKPHGPKMSLPKFQFKLSAPPLQLAQVAPAPMPMSAPSVTFARTEAVKAVAPMSAPAAAPPMAPAPAEPSLNLARTEAVSQAPLSSAPASGPPSYVAPAAPPLADVDSLLADAAPTTQASQAASSVAAAAAGSYQLQAGVFASKLNAEALASRLGDVGLPNVEPFQRNGQTLYRVVVRGFTNPTAAAAARTQAAAMGVPDARVIAGAL